MTESGPRFASQFAPQRLSRRAPGGRSPLAHLLHALNQPLTGLQCSLELAVAGPRPAEQYVRTLHEGLELTGRMRILVETLRELADLDPCVLPSETLAEEMESLRFDELVRITAADLLPVAASKSIRVLLVCPTPLLVRGERPNLAALMFRFLDAALSLAREESELRIAATAAREHVCLEVSWSPGSPPEHSPFSRQELGLLIAQAEWERAGAEWTHARNETTETCGVQFHQASARRNGRGADLENLK